MLTDEQFTRINNAMPLLQQASPPMLRDFQRATYYAKVPSGRDLFAQGDEVNAIALLLSGEVRVYKIGETGREITLYRLGSGQSCILTANAILSNQSFSAIATIEQDAEAIMIPADTFRGWVAQYDLWRNFVFSLLSQRLSSMMEIVDEVAFQRLDIRVATLLLERSQQQNPITITHQEIAAELGSSREVISRVLGGFANQNAIRLSRGTIEILDSGALKQFTSM